MEEDYELDDEELLYNDDWANASSDFTKQYNRMRSQIEGAKNVSVNNNNNNNNNSNNYYYSNNNNINNNNNNNNNNSNINNTRILPSTNTRQHVRVSNSNSWTHCTSSSISSNGLASSIESSATPSSSAPQETAALVEQLNSKFSSRFKIGMYICFVFVRKFNT
jgi:hypothetical protein